MDESKWKLNDKLVAELVAEVSDRGSARRGERIYRREQLQCMKCHAIGGAGGAVGPDLVSIGASAQVDYLVESLIEPNRKVKENYHTQMYVLAAGKIVSGIPVREGGAAVVIRDAEDREVVIPKANIEDIIETSRQMSTLPSSTIQRKIPIRD